MSTLSTEQQNFVKDVLKVIGQDDTLNHQFARALALNDIEFNEIADATFKACENGRVTFDEGEPNKLI